MSVDISLAVEFTLFDESRKLALDASHINKKSKNDRDLIIAKHLNIKRPTNATKIT
jgi:hypothetical protein